MSPLSLAIVTLLATPSAATSTPPVRSALVPEPVEPSGASALGRKAAELVRARLEANGVVTVTEEEALARATGKGESVAFAKARAALARGKDEYLQLELERAVSTLSEARRGFQRALLETGVFEPYAETLAYQGAAFLGLGDATAAREAFVELVRVRPDYQLDAAVYPPEVLDAFAGAKVDVHERKRARLQVASSPPLATLIVDGVTRGQTPTTVAELVPGPHAVRVELPGRLPWWGMVDVSPSGTRVTVRLEEDALSARMGAFREAVQGGARGRAFTAGAELARSARTDGVVALGFQAVDGRYVLSAALVVAEAPLRVAWTTIDEDFLQADVAAEALVSTLLRAPADTPALAPSDVPPPAPPPDFETSLLGLAPPDVADVAGAGAGATHARDLESGGEDARDDGTAWIWWVGAGALVGAAALAAGGGLGVWYALTPAETVRQPDTLRVTVGLER